MTDSVSPLAPASFPRLPSVAGVELGTAAAGIRKKERTDLLVAKFSPGTSVAGVFTRSLCPAAPVEWCRRIIDSGDGTARALVCNSGNANAFTGKAGEVSTELTAVTVASSLGVPADSVLVASTGVIGEPMPDDRLTAALPPLLSGLSAAGSEGWEQAADAIRTTDTFSKGAYAPIPGTGSSVVGIAKGSGMIAPDMATMLGFVFTDLAIAPEILQESLTASVNKSFNRITVDSDTSTNDTVLLFATGAGAEEPIMSREDPRLEAFQGALEAVTLDLAQQIIRDGEGATKFVAVNVTGAASEESAVAIGRSIANSPLVKTALAAGDANWGRVVMAVGKAGQPANRDKLAIWIGPEQVAASGTVLDGYREEVAAAHLALDEVEITVSVGVGEHEATVWTCDLTHGYIEINAGYRT
ncbi:MAG: bifunctional glutamate N-acetyltransferase/amino-acid acetyltransferase ArgJ [Acidimicrobiia bacterium]